jgi:transposase
MRFVSIKTVEQQSILMLHRARMPFIRQRTTTINALRAHWLNSALWHVSGAMD